MMFWRIYNNQIVSAEETELVGWDINAEYFEAPDEYIEQKKFIVFRTCFGVGDWAMLERMPKALKQNYPDCEVYLPSPKMIRNIFGSLLNNWSSWGDASKTVDYVFKNTPYVDGYVDTWHTEIYHDHFRIWDSNNWKTPLTKQMCRFHHIDYDDLADASPKVYFDDEEIIQGNDLIKNYPEEYYFLHISKRYKTEYARSLLACIENLGVTDKPFVCYSDVDIKDTEFNKLNIIENIKYIEEPRMQFYIKSKAKIVITIQTGTSDLISGLTDVYSLSHYENVNSTYRNGNYVPSVNFINGVF